MRVLYAAVAAIICVLLADTAAAQQPIEEVAVVARRLPPSSSDALYAGDQISRGELDSAAPLRLDEVLRRLPAVSLFRRASSLSAHPTTQGVTLRGLGPNGAGRTLVLLDGVPQNDPFGGWVYWSALENLDLENIDVLPGSGAGRWGNGAIAGVISLTSRLPTETGADARASYGAYDTFEAAGRAAFASENTVFEANGGYFESDGFPLLSPALRGPVDVPAASDAWHAGGRLSQRIDDRTRLTVRVGRFEESRVNGLRLSQNSTDTWDLSTRLVHDGGRDRPSFELTGYFRDTEFQNGFASVSDDRTEERSVLDQFSVPGRGAGVGLFTRFPLAGGADVEVGVDHRRMSGATNELFRNLGDGFTRLRRAGGRERLTGAFAEYAGRSGQDWSFMAGGRIDRWSTAKGERTESNLANGDILRSDDISDRSGWVANGRLAAGYRLNAATRLRGALFTGFRLPTVNEFYRPFRVGNDITEANPFLDPERIYGLDVGVNWEEGDTALSAGYFRNWFSHAVGNVTIAVGPGTFPPTGFVPDGGTLRQRQNIGRIAADGIELSARQEVGEEMSIAVRYLYVDARVTRFAQMSDLVGRALAQSPKHRLTSVVEWHPAGGWRGSAELRYVGKQFDDDQNSRTLAGFVTVNLWASRAINENAEIFAAVENLFDARIVSAVSATGLETLGQPRLWRFGIRANY